MHGHIIWLYRLSCVTRLVFMSQLTIRKVLSKLRFSIAELPNKTAAENYCTQMSNHA